MERECEQCGKRFTAKTRRARFCSGKCRAAKSDGRPPTRPVAPVERPAAGPTEAATRAQLERLRKLDDPLGAAALVLAARLDAGDTGSSMAALARELRATLTELARGVPVANDGVDELERRRLRRLQGA